MSVPKNRRKDAAAQFIQDARELRVITMRIVKKFPKSYRWIITNNMLQLAGEIYINCIKANSIYLHEKLSEQDFELRSRYLRIAIADTEALLAEISFCYELVDDGNNYFRDKNEYVRQFSRWVEQGNTVLNRIQALAKSDKKRWKAFHEA